jgi:hypothetical protein
VIFFLLLAVAPAPERPAALAKAEQLLLVVADDWNAPTAKVQRYTKRPRGWEAVTPALDVMLGKNGLAWGKGVVTLKGFGGAPSKPDDARSIAGVFALGKLRGYETAAPPGGSSEFEQLSDGSVCIEDPRSKKYGMILDAKKAVKPDWKIAKPLRTDDLAYAWMLPVQTAGCVSFHLGAAPDAANIVLKAEDMQTLARWVVPSKTVYVALPKEAYKSLKASWRLP